MIKLMLNVNPVNFDDEFIETVEESIKKKSKKEDSENMLMLHHIDQNLSEDEKIN